MSGNPVSIPPNFQSVLKNLENYAKQTVRCDPDRYTGVNHGDTIKVNLPPNTYVDLRSLCIYYKGTTLPNGRTGATGPYQNHFFPRNSASIIDSLSININGQRIETITDYNHLYNILWDHSCSLENNHTAKRALENTDPFTKSVMTPTGVITRYITNDEETANITDSNRRFAVTNWLGFLGSSSSEIINTRNLGEVQLEIRLAPAAGFLFKSAQPSTGAVSHVFNATPSYTLDDIYFTITRITFQDDTLYNIENGALMDQGIPLAYKTFVAHRSKLTNKSIDMSFSVNTQRLNKLICTVIPSTYNTEGLLLTEAGKTQLEALAANDALTFNSSVYFQKDGAGILTSEVSVNNNSVSQAPLKPYEIFINNMDALNITQDMNGGIHAGCYDINAWQKYWFCHIIPFEHRQSDNAFWVQGMDGRAAAINFKWNTTHDAANTVDVYPLVFSEQTKVLNITAGQQVTVKF